MSTVDWKAVKHVLAEALARPPEERHLFLQQACGHDETLRAEVLGLIDHHDRAGSFLEPAAGGVPAELGGVLLADRYRLGRLCGLGGFGSVYEAEDLLAHRRVAVKVFRQPADVLGPAMRHEVATLRWLRVPGVVQLLDDGITDGRAFVVMEYVEGSPFPGTAPRDWTGIREVTTALIETLARIHWAGVIHCDLKPNNVLVRPDGVPVVLDLGISAGPAVGTSSPDMGLAGTPRYAAPERFSGGEPTEKWDLYSIGVMLREALTAAAPRDPIADGLPADVADLIDQLIAEDPVDRPASAAAVLDVLRGDEPDLPWLGSTSVVDALVDAGLAGRSLDVCGPAGAGRSRCLREAAERLRRDGRQVILAAPEDRPLASLVGIVGEPAAGDFDAAHQATAERLRDLLASGTVLVVDDTDAIDPFSVAVIAACRHTGCVLRALTRPEPGALELRALHEAELKDLFAGPDRVVHLREDAAGELFRRTAGRPADIAREIAAWVRAGLARREASRFVVTRAALEQLRLGLRPAAPLPVAAQAPDEHNLVLTCVHIAGEHTTPALIAEATGLAPWRADAYLMALVRAGAIQPRPDGGYESRASPSSAGMWPMQSLRTLHSLVADRAQPNTLERLLHLLAARRLDDVVAETPAIARQLLLSGRVWAAESLLLESLRALHASEDPGRDDAFLPFLLQCALADGTSTSLDLVLYYCGRSRTSTRLLLTIDAIARAAQLVMQGDRSRALALLATPTSLDDPLLERARHAVRVIAASGCALDIHQTAVTSAVAWAELHSDPTIRALALEWLGWLRYRERRYAEAARLHQESAALSQDPHKRIAALLGAAWAELEALDLPHAGALATSARDLAAQCRHAHYEARAELILRAVAYRSGEHGTPDLELVDSMEMLGVPRIHGTALLTEAAVAWRQGSIPLARSLSLRASTSLRLASVPCGAALARSLAVLCGAADDIAELERDATECLIPGLSLQALALLARSGHVLTDHARAIAAAHIESLRTDDSDSRREVISPHEARVWLQL